MSDVSSISAGPSLVGGGYMESLPLDPKHGGDGSNDWGSDYQYRTFEDGQVYVLRTAFETGLDRTHDYPSSAHCQTDSSDPVNYPQCGWSDPQCVYVTGSSCETYWLQVNSGE